MIMFEAKLSNTYVIKNLVDAITAIIDDGSFEISNNGISLQAMDTSHVSLVSMCLRSSAFDPYRCDRKLSLGIPLKQLLKIMKCADTKDSMTLRADDDNADVLHIVFESRCGEKLTEFAMKLHDIDSELIEIPETSYNAVIEMPSVEFMRVCRDLSGFGEAITICVTKDGAQFSVKGDNSNARVNYSPTGTGSLTNGVSIDVSDACTLTFAVKYLNTFTKASSLSERVKLSLSDDSPLDAESHGLGRQLQMVEYKIERMQGFLKYYLAPKLEGDS